MSDPLKTFPDDSPSGSSELNARFQDLRRDAAQSADSAGQSVAHGAKQAAETLMEEAKRG